MNTTVSPGLSLRGVTPPLSLKNFGLIAFDMDSTLINIECVDEVADAAGRKAEVAAITEAAMRGEIADYKDSLRRRVALLKGVPEGALNEVYQQRLRLNPGAAELVQVCKAAGLKVLACPLAIDSFTVKQHWHVRFHQDPGNVWLRKVIWDLFGKRR